ncbi:glycoside hydrolase family 3 protein [Bifidobacterium sp. 82T10]|uniref:Glycoside hydrolase family 3 protein n=1 Tax=Bifidobacterium miconis TaxID=2834435 RepID=A0ABS6WDV6_9BIFI|nr:glycoside hydrolase family 3 N-terminal domain-containing protein [Bifidobacterium miconis]MBW3092218.1 glycoside hydrolase family 3 protein [Bifidobacterium miconis]
MALCAALAVTMAGCAQAGQTTADGNKPAQSATQSPRQEPTNQPQSSPNRDDHEANAVPEPRDDSPAGKAKRAVAAMSLEERIGQLIMAPLFAGSAPSVLQDLIANRHVGSVLLIGNWNGGVASVRAATDALQSYAPDGNRLLITADQEGGLVQHLQGPGFDAMPSAVGQGLMDAATLRSSAAAWGAQLAQAGVNVDLAPVVDTVVGDRAANAPIGALDRDFGLDANGNADHAIAFVQGMRDAGVAASIKHYPGLGAVSGNTDFTADGIVDATTALNGPEIGAFTRVIREARPAMVMMSLATYQHIDAEHPAAFSPTIIDGYLRGTTGYEGVVTSDSLSATAVSGVPADQLGVRFVEAGGDLACIGDLTYVQPILDGLLTRARADAAFAAKATRAAERVMTLKYETGLAA